MLPGYAELVKLDRLRERDERDLRRIAAGLLARHVDRLPETNPVAAFAERLGTDLAALEGDVEAYHAYAFATLRQCGAAWSMLAEFLAWLGASGAAAEQAAALAGGSRTLLLKLARVVHSGRPLDASAILAGMADTWDALAVELQKARAARVA
jgi:hypothetical protein